MILINVFLMKIKDFCYRIFRADKTKDKGKLKGSVFLWKKTSTYVLYYCKQQLKIIIKYAIIYKIIKESTII